MRCFLSQRAPSRLDDRAIAVELNDDEQGQGGDQSETQPADNAKDAVK